MLFSMIASKGHVLGQLKARFLYYKNLALSTEFIGFLTYSAWSPLKVTHAYQTVLFSLFKYMSPFGEREGLKG